MINLKGIVAGAVMSATALSAGAATFIGDRTDFRDETIYFAMTTRFYDGDHSNNTYCWDGVLNQNDPEWRGDFKGLIEKLDYIKALGFTAIWITPVVENASGLDYHGYHAFDFKKVDPRYESQDVTFQTLIDAVHAKGMKLILDIVLQHTGNFGEETLCPMFVKDYSQNMSNINKSMKLHPNSKLPSNYYSLKPEDQYGHRLGLMKNTRGENQDTHNYWHHYAHFNWDNATRWWGQIAGDCVDLNTENPATSNYIVDCYSNFIKMGVDGFRIDTSGHIARLTFNKAFIPQLHEAAKSPEAIAKRGNTPFYMFGEVCARAEEVIYRDGDYNCSPCFYTWKEEKDYPWDYSETSWDNVVVMEGETGDHVNANSVLQQGEDYTGKSKIKHSNNAWLDGNDYHTPDYSMNSGFNVIDFPMHWRFHRASNAFGVRTQDDYYNDATWNVVYVDGHDYGPNNWDTKSFGGTLNEWAENLSLMFTFRGIPCIFQGSETYFRKGNIIDKGALEPLKNTSRAYYGGYLTGSVNTTDFGVYSNATGNLAASLSHPLALHLQRLNKIRAAVPALRKGQYSTEGCSGNMAFKRRYKDANVDSYVLVTVSGNATFTGVLNGTYKDAITGDVKTVTNGTLTAECDGQGNLRVYVLNGPGKIGDDGQFLYASAPVTATQLPYDGNEEAGDTETVRDTEDYDPGQTARVSFSPNGGAFRTETLTVTAKLDNGASSGWFKVGNNASVSLSGNESKNFTIGEGMNYGDNVTVTWGADDYTGSVVFTKVDPDAVTTIYVTGKNDADISGTNLYAWNGATEYAGAWPGTALTNTVEIDGRSFYSYTLDTADPVNIIFSRNGQQTDDIKGVSGDVYYEYDGASNAEKIDVVVGPKAPVVHANPASGTTFTTTLQVALTVSPAVDIYYTLNGQPASASSTKYTGPITLTETTTINTYAKNEVGEKNQSFTYTKVDKPDTDSMTVYFLDSADWGNVNAYCWDDEHKESTAFSGAWPGKQLTETVTFQNAHPDVDGKPLYKYTINTTDELKNPKIIFNGGGQQTKNYTFVANGIYRHDQGDDAEPFAFVSTGVNNIESVASEINVYNQAGKLVIESGMDCTVQAVRLDGTVRELRVCEGYNFFELPKGFYIVAGKKVII
ncbi:MAG: starch-binding protein [Bacteroidales bacterium]|nr:starch-binding protein [Bacteroidales bacterium]